MKAHPCARSSTARTSQRARPPGAADARREELLLPDRGRDPAHAGGGHQARAAAEERGRRSGAGAPSAASSTRATTLRKNLQYGGVPFRIVFDRKRKDKPQVMVLCDVSDSVRNVSRFMLQFVYSLQDLYSKVRSFIFVADIGEMTQLFEEHDDQPGDRAGAARQRHQRLRALRLRARVPGVPPRPPGGGEQAHDGDHPRRRAQQLQPAARVGAAGRPAARQAGDLAESRRTG